MWQVSPRRNSLSSATVISAVKHLTLPSDKPIGILGGTFDPIHYGHLRPALEALEDLGLAEIRFIPCRQPPHRELPLASPEQRLALIERAIAGQPGFLVDDRELQREGPSFMVDTLNSLRSELGGEIPLCLLLGMDAFIGLARWHRWQELPDLAHLIILHRPGTDMPRSDFIDSVKGWHSFSHPLRLREQPAGGILFQPVTQLDISATQIRSLIAVGKSPRYLLPEAVLNYILDQNLYG